MPHGMRHFDAFSAKASPAWNSGMPPLEGQLLKIKTENVFFRKRLAPFTVNADAGISKIRAGLRFHTVICRNDC